MYNGQRRASHERVRGVMVSGVLHDRLRGAIVSGVVVMTASEV